MSLSLCLQDLANLSVTYFCLAFLTSSDKWKGSIVIALIKLFVVVGYFCLKILMSAIFYVKDVSVVMYVKNHVPVDSVMLTLTHLVSYRFNNLLLLFFGWIDNHDKVCSAILSTIQSLKLCSFNFAIKLVLRLEKDLCVCIKHSGVHKLLDSYL